jgi:membrane dipeptidase
MNAYKMREEVHPMKNSKRQAILVSVCMLLFLITPYISFSQGEVDNLHRKALVWDCHNDLVYRVMYEKLDIGKRLPAGHVDIPRLKEGQVDVQTVALFVQNFLYPDKCAQQAFLLIEAMKKAIDKNADSVELARTGADVGRIVRAGKIAMPLAIEGGHAIEDDLGLLQKFHRLGVSSMTLTHNITHGWADSSGDKPKWGGLNDLGRTVIKEMNRIGMAIDISHVSDEAFFDVMEMSEDPVIASHSGCRALNPHHRNMSDKMLRALGKNGGVIGIVFVLPFLTPEYNEAMGNLYAISQPWFRKAPQIKDLEARIAIEHLRAGQDWPMENLPTIEHVLDHIDHAVKMAGVDHVGLGADMYPRTPSPIGIRGAQDYPQITKGLKNRGYEDEDIVKILGSNFLRVWKTVTD